MAIYIRHAKDKYVKGDKEYDTSLTQNGLQDAFNLGKKLVELYGTPDVIYCSPFRRARQTARTMVKSLGLKVPIYVDINLSRYPGTEKDYSDKVRDDTKKYGFLLRETKDEFKVRVKKHVEWVKSICKKNNLLVWVISHAVVITRVCKYLEISFPEHLKSRDWINIRDGESSWKQNKRIRF